MSDVISRVWPEWHVEELLGQGSFGSVYRAVRSGHGHTSQAAIKVIEVPQSSGELHDLVASGMDEASLRSYFEQRARSVLGEVTLMEELKGAPNIVAIEDYQLVEHDGGIGWTVLVRMPLLEPLSDYYARVGQPDVKEVARLGSDICQALSACHAKGVIHRDVKPENIFRGPYGYLLGDFGIARHLELGGGSAHTRAGAYPYMAPEVFAGKGYGSNVDTYSLGLVLYRYLNNGRAPFLPAEGAFTPADNERAVALRLAGRPLPMPANADAELTPVVLRATDPDPAKRFGSAAEMGSALTNGATSFASAASAQPASKAASPRPASAQASAASDQRQGTFAAQTPYGPTGTVMAGSSQPSGQSAFQGGDGFDARPYEQQAAQPYGYQQSAQPYVQAQVAGAGDADRGSSGKSSAGRIGLIVAGVIVAVALLAFLFGGNAGCGSSSSSTDPGSSTTSAPGGGADAGGSSGSASDRWDDDRSGASAGNMLIDDDICTVEVTSMYTLSSDDDLYFHVAITNHSEDDLTIWSPDQAWTVNGWEADCVFAIDCAAGATNDAEIFYIKGDKLPAKFQSTEDVESVTGALVVSLLSEGTPSLEIQYDVSLTGDAIPSADAATDSEPSASQGDEGASASYDDLSGTYVTTGFPPNGYLTSASLTDTELILVGDLHEQTGSGSEGASVGDKTWVFKVDGSTTFGYSAEGFHEQSREEFAERLESLSFPALRLTIENGTVVEARMIS